MSAASNKVVVHKAETFIRRTYRNSHAIRAGYVPCETNPDSGGLSKTGHAFHAVAVVTVGSVKGNKRHVCAECADRYHRHQKQEGGIVWD